MTTPKLTREAVERGDHTIEQILALLTDRNRLREACEAAERFIFDDTCRHDSEKASVLTELRAALAESRRA